MAAGPSLLNERGPVIKDPCEALLDEKRVDDLPKGAPGHHIMNGIDHFNTAFNGFKPVFVKPESKRPHSLFVNKLTLRYHVFDFGDPGHGNPSNGSDSVGDDQSITEVIRDG